MKKQVILMSLAIAGLLCCIPMFVLNAPGAPGLSGGAASLLGLAGAVLFGTCAGTLLQLKRLSRDPDYRQRQKAQCDERTQAIRDRAGEVLLWLLLFGAAYLYFFGVPKWVSLILLTLACVKLLLDWMFTVWYRRQY